MNMKREKIRIIIISLVVFIIITGVTMYGYRQPQAISQTEDGFVTKQVLDHLAEIAVEPTPVGSEQHKQVRDYLVNVLSELGLNPEIQSAYAINPYWRTGAVINNVVTRIPGSESSKAILLVANYDSMPTSPGANANKAAVASVLEIVRVVLAEAPLKNDLIILFADAGEIGALGALAFAEQHPWMEEVGLVLNAEARGTSGASVLFGTSRRNGWLISQYAQAVSQPLGNSFIHELYRLMNHDHSFTVFNQAQIPGLNLAYLDKPTYYHTAFDNLENIDLTSIQQQGNNLLQLVKHFGNLELQEISQIDQIYFDLFGLKLVHYPITWIANLITITIIMFGIVVWQGMKNYRFNLKGILYGILIFALIGLFSGVLMSYVGDWLVPNHPLYKYIQPNNGIWYLVGLSSLTATLFILLYSWAFNKLEELDLIFGTQIVWLVITIFISLFLPGTSYLFIWPYLFSLLGTLLYLQWDEPSWIIRAIAILLSFVPVITLWPVLLKQVFVILGLSSSGILMLLFVYALGLLLPLIKEIKDLNVRILPAISLVLLLFSIVMVYTQSGVTATQPGMNSIFYYADLDQEQAYWVSIDLDLDEFTEQFFPAGFTADNLQHLIPYEYVPIIKGSAPKWNESPVAVNLIGEVIREEVREIHLHVKPLQEHVSLIVHIKPELVTEQVEIAGNMVAWEEHWPVFRYYNIPAEGINLVVPTAIDSNFSITILSQLYGLPDFFGDNFIQRPEYLIPAPTPITDTTILSKTYVFN